MAVKTKKIPQLVSRGSSASASDCAIRCGNLWKTYDGSISAVTGVDISVDVGECYGLLGPNGAGKTTIVEILEGLLDPSSGEVELLGRTWEHDARELRVLIGVSLQETRLSEKLTVRETVELFSSFYPSRFSPSDTLNQVDLSQKGGCWVEKLSGGERQRLAVALALVGDPKILFLDEPTSGLDPQSRRDVWEVIRRFVSKGGTVFLTTHFMEEAERLCSRVAILDRGRVLVEGSPSQLIQRFGGHHLIDFAIFGETEGLLEALSKLPGVESARSGGGVFSMKVHEPHVTIPALLALLEARSTKLAQLMTRQSTLEDVFVTIAGRRLQDG
jgi:ABC-2 type transport system ATP-binding protein